MCHSDSTKKLATLFLAVIASLAPADAQSNSSQISWRRVGGATFDAGLAAPATGPMTAVWFSPDGGKLYARSVSGTTWETADFETWSPATDAPAHGSSRFVDVKGPEQARVVLGPDGTLYALGANLSRSGDNGRTWINLTAFNGMPVIGFGQNDLAVSARDPQSIYVANAWGVWSSHDGGLSWSGMNVNLPNLPITALRTEGNRIGASLGQLGTVELTPGASIWEPSGLPEDYSAVSAALDATVTAFTAAGDTAYAGSSDGRIWVSRDKQASWTLSPNTAGGRVERIFADKYVPNFALVASSGNSRSILRTINSGQFWDDVTGALVDNPAHGVSADRASGAIYLATERGLFWVKADLNALGPLSIWNSLGGLPSAAVRDVKVSGTRLLVAVDGYGVYAASTPSITGKLRVVSSADLAERPASPGALMSVLGGKVQVASAGGLSFPVLASASDESQIQVPFEAAGSQLSLSLDTGATRSTMTVALRSVSPAIFLDRDESPILMDAETGLVLDPRISLRPNMRIQMLATGLGKTTPNWPTAIPAPAENPPAVSAQVQVFLGRQILEVTRATLAPGYVGLYLIELRIPALIDSGPTELSLTADGVESNRVRVYLSQEN